MRTNRLSIIVGAILLTHYLCCQYAQSSDFEHEVVSRTTHIAIKNDRNTPIDHYYIDCDHDKESARWSHIIAKIGDDKMPLVRLEDGRCKIDLSSKPIEPGHPNKPTMLTITKTFTHLELVPSHDVYLMPRASIHYQVRIISHGHLKKIKVPSERYYLLVDDRDLVDLDESTSTAYAMDVEGTTTIRFIDRHSISDDDFVQPHCNIHVVQPSYITMSVTPGDSWDLRKFTDYVIEIKIFDADSHQIYQSDNLNIQLSSGNELVITNSTSNGTYHTIHTLNSGPSKLVARLIGTSSSLFDRSSTFDIEHTQDVTIHEPLEIRPTAIILPWLAESKPSYQVSIFAAGGTGSYLWSANNTNLVSITYGGDDSSIAKITTNGEGVALIDAMDTKSSVFQRSSLIVVSRIVELNILPSITETEVGGDILLPVAVFANRTSLIDEYLVMDDGESDTGLVLFDDCSKVIFTVEIVEKTRFTHDSKTVLPNVRPRSCASLKFTCTQPGSSRIWISYVDPTNPTSKPIRTTTILACYKPLKSLYPSDVGVLAVDTQIDLAFEGGPRPFGSRLDDHFAHLEPKNKILTFEPIIDRFRHNKDLHVFRIDCKQYGEIELTLNVGNQPSPTLPNPASSSASIRIACAKPHSLQLRPRLKDSCPLNELDTLLETIVPVSNMSPTDFELEVLDELKRKFLNISSLSIRWTLNGHGRITTDQRADINAIPGYQRITRNYITVTPNRKEGLGRLQADLNKDLSTYLDVQYVDYATIKPDNLIVYNHKNNIVVLPILKGSGYFSVEALQGARHANVSHVSVYGDHRIYITPLSVGKFMLRLEDQCLDLRTGAPMLAGVNLVTSKEFLDEYKLPGRVLRHCDDIDESLNCQYLSVERVLATTTRAPTTTVRPTLAVPVTEPPRPTTTQVPIRTEPPRVERPITTTVGPKITFDEYQPSPESRGGQVVENRNSIFKRVFAYLMMIVVTAAAVSLGYKWWQEQARRRPRGPPQGGIADSSFLRQSPSSASSKFSPSSSRGPTSSTPRARPLYTERFSTTLLTD